ncbi:MAG TPA: T9SS type A sorting domain-containing protein [Bacteroidales bacterium]|nr:T9SS type A sorting domain-containing protein [Bacteroidales bacterium]
MKYLLCVIFSAHVFVVFSQQAILTSGGDANQGSGSISYSVSQINCKTHSGIEGSVAEGVQQPYEISVIDNFESETIQMNISVFPNPTVHILNLKIEDADFSDLNFKLFDLNGNQINGKKITSSDTQLNFSNLASSTYYLRIYHGERQVKAFKIIKNQ